MENRVTAIGLNAFSLYSLIMSLIYGIIVLVGIMLVLAVLLHSNLFYDWYYKGVTHNRVGVDSMDFVAEKHRLGALVWYYTRIYNFILNKEEGPMYTTNSTIEIAWTMFPVFVLLIIMIPSLLLLYSMEDLNMYHDNITMKVLGHQWYWSYEYINNDEIFANFDKFFMDLNMDNWSSIVKKSGILSLSNVESNVN